MSSLKRTLEVNTPHVDPEWAQGAVGELRQRGADGAQIGAALLEVESHLAESGATAADSFGHPTEYAAALDLPVGVKWTPSKVIGAAAVGIVVYLGGTLAYTGVLAGITEAEAQLPILGLAFGLVLVGATAASMPYWKGPLRVILGTPVRWVVAVVSLGAVLGAVLLLASGPQLTLAPAAMVLAGLLILAALGLIVFAVRRIGKQPHDDPLRFPSV